MRMTCILQIFSSQSNCRIYSSNRHSSSRCILIIHLALALLEPDDILQPPPDHQVLGPDPVSLPLLLVVEHVEEGPELGVAEVEVLGHLVRDLRGPVLVHQIQLGDFLIISISYYKLRITFRCKKKSCFC